MRLGCYLMRFRVLSSGPNVQQDIRMIQNESPGDSRSSFAALDPSTRSKFELLPSYYGDRYIQGHVPRIQPNSIC